MKVIYHEKLKRLPRKAKKRILNFLKNANVFDCYILHEQSLGLGRAVFCNGNVRNVPMFTNKGNYIQGAFYPRGKWLKA